MKATTALLSDSLLALAATAPTPTQNKRSATSDCAQYGETTVGSYTIYNDLWGQDNGSGSQCVTVTGLNDSSLQWSTTWSWSNNPNDVKSYSNAVASFDSTALSGITSMQSTWDWSYTGDDLVADVAYDMFTSSTASATEEFEIMVWLAALGSAGPISATYSASGDAESIATPTVAGYSWSLYKGSNGAQTVYSFVPSQNVSSFSGDVYDFFTYLIDSQSFDSSQFLVSVGAGTEAFTGQSAEFTVSGYSIDIATGSSGTSSEAASSASNSAAVSTSSVVASSSAAVAASSAAPTSASSAAPSSTDAAVGTGSPASSGIAQPAGVALTSGVAQASGVTQPSGVAGPSGTAPPSGVARPSGFAQPSGGHHPPPGAAKPTGFPSAGKKPGCDVEYVYI
ncbi:hypothetical protein B0A50_03811 [Salinomyces thailandicus]|uniref:Uncharacterized protein n=1 Tax=Salinomyces thailandicus TaxID=706561 RepID=A0A4U0U0X7_9PEZI|nr:hypothetical protein B0A50_03811 [Salinomyces thailandica]